MLAGQVLLGLPGNPFGDYWFGKRTELSGCMIWELTARSASHLTLVRQGPRTREYQGPYADDSTAYPEAAQA